MVRLTDPKERSISTRGKVLICAFLLGMLALLGITHEGETGDIPERIPETTTTLCFEDMECWDCETMGNRICGPVRP